MELFRTDTQIFSGENCGTEYVHDPDHMRTVPAKNPGCRLTFVRPWEELGGHKSVTVETPKGNLYFQFSTEYDKAPGPYHPKHTYYGPGDRGGIRHYYDDYDLMCRPKGDILDNSIYHSASYGNVTTAKSGDIIIYSLASYELDPDSSSATKGAYAKAIKKVVEKEGFKCLYQSDIFYNWVHSERLYPSLVVVVLEKL